MKRQNLFEGIVNQVFFMSAGSGCSSSKICFTVFYQFYRLATLRDFSDFLLDNRAHSMFVHMSHGDRSFEKVSLVGLTSR